VPVQRRDRVRLPNEPHSVLVRGVDQDRDEVTLFYERENGTRDETTLTIDAYEQLQAIRPTGSGDSRIALAGLWGYWITGAIAGIRQAALATTPLRAYAHQDDAVYSHMLPQPTLRFLLADEPGTGKTIMCGMYITEMLRQNRLKRVLLVVPAHLLPKWERDLQRFFGIEAERITAEVGRSSAPLRPDRDFWLISVDLLARNQQVQQKAVFAPEAAWDLVVFDEGHRLTPTAQADFPIAVELAARATHLLILTATPHRGSEYLFRALLHLLDPDVYQWRREDQNLLGPGSPRLKPARMHFLRRMKEQLRDHDGVTPLFPPRRAHNVSVPLSATEQQLYENVLAYCDAYMDDTTQLARSVYGKRAASSLYAISETLRRRSDRLRAGEAGTSLRVVAPLTEDDLLGEDDEDQTNLEGRANAVRSRDIQAELAYNNELRTQISALTNNPSFVSAKWQPLQTILTRHGITAGGYGSSRLPGR
jgi:SNF2 family DNA or RNA helicase